MIAGFGLGEVVRGGGSCEVWVVATPPWSIWLVVAGFKSFTAIPSLVEEQARYKICEFRLK
jgi:hypothetical protein